MSVPMQMYPDASMQQVAPINSPTVIMTGAPVVIEPQIVEKGYHGCLTELPCFDFPCMKNLVGCSFCNCYDGVAFSAKNSYIPNTCLPYRIKTFWNANVGPHAMSAEGIPVVLADSAQQKIRAAYNGQALTVKIKKFSCFECFVECGCGCCACCVDCCKCPCCQPLEVDRRVKIKKIYFGTSDRQSTLPNCCGHICYGICGCCLHCCEPSVNLTVDEVYVQGAPTKMWMH